MLNRYKAKTLKNILIRYNKSVRKKTYSGVSRLNRGQVETIINRDFILTDKRNGSAHQFKHKDKRFTKIINKDKQ
tara:strand:- start:226 stop:450 length:225 start_codon:yes stop_codon:yes gene_type:complete